MSVIRLENLTAFGRLALKLDGDFSELTRLSGQLQRLDIDSESGLERAFKLLEQFAQHGKNISEGIQDFSKTLDAAREQSELAARAVAERAQLIGQRKLHQRQIRERLIQLEQEVAAANASLAGFKKEGKKEFSDEEQQQIRAELERLNVHLKKFLADAQEIKQAANQSKFKSIEQDAQALADVPRSSCRRVDKVIAG